MKKVALLILLTVVIVGCTRGGKTTCGLGTFITSSTTVKCDKVTFSIASNLPEDQLRFMTKTYARVSEEASRGHGEHLYALSALLECKNPTLLMQELHSNYATIFDSDSDPANSLQRIHSLVKSAPSLHNSCSRVSGG